MNKEQKPRILILSSADQTFPEHIEINENFTQTLKSKIGDEVDLEWHNYHDIRIDFESNGFEVYLKQDNTPLSSFDFVYIKSYFRHSELAGAIVSYLDLKKVKFVCTELRNHPPLSKLTQFVRLSTGQVPIIRSVFMLTGQFVDNYEMLTDKLGTPFVFKTIAGGGGADNFLVKNHDEFKSILNNNKDVLFVAQEYVENDSDLRVLIVGGEIKLVIKRQRTDENTHLNNTTQGAEATLVPLEDIDPVYRQMALKSAEIMGREIAGVDLMFESGTDKPYILEVNASPQVATGAFVEEKLEIYSNYFKNVLKYKN